MCHYAQANGGCKKFFAVRLIACVVRGKRVYSSLKLLFDMAKNRACKGGSSVQGLLVAGDLTRNPESRGGNPSA